MGTFDCKSWNAKFAIPYNFSGIRIGAHGASVFENDGAGYRFKEVYLSKVNLVGRHVNNGSCFIFKSIEFPEYIGMGFCVSIRYDGFETNIEESRHRFMITCVS
jgi:hypothetical protein